MIQAQSANLSTTVVALIAAGGPQSRELIAERYGKGLLFLIFRRCPANAAVQCYTDVIGACVDAIRERQVVRDDQIPPFLRATFRAISSKFPPHVPAHPEEVVDETIVEAARKALSIFDPIQLEALRRFYVEKESLSCICTALRLGQDQFQFVRKVARLSVAQATDLPKKRADSIRIDHHLKANGSTA